MDQKKNRKNLNDYSEAYRSVQLTGAAIDILESTHTRAAAAAIKRLKGDQHRLLKLMDAAAKKLGAPYGA